MLYDFMGHDRALTGYRDFFRTWSASRDHPALQDLVAAMRPCAVDSAAYDAFVRQWFEDRVVPEYRLSGARKTARGRGWEVTASVRNVGTGRMPVEVAASAGERWVEASRGASGPTGGANPKYREARTTVTLGAGESRTVRIHCDFAPERVVVDPDVRVLQLRRKLAVARV
jgi:ABC-2 type transport system permease protein